MGEQPGARTDAELLAAVAERDRGALRELYERHEAWLVARVPIGCGGKPLDGTNAWPTEWRAASNALAATVVPGADDPTFDDAETVLVETLAAAEAPVRIVALGPLTNIAAVLERDPSLADRIEQIVVMGGAVSVAGNVEPDRAAEWNFHAHPSAARSVIESGVPILLVPLDATDHVPLTSGYVDAVGSVDNDLAALETTVLGSLAGLDGMFMWDESAAVIAVQPEVATWDQRSLIVDGEGATVESPDGSAVDVAIDVDAASVRSIVLDALTTLGT